MPGKPPQQDPSDAPLFFYFPDAADGEFCQWYLSPFRVSKAQIASLITYKNDEDTPATTDGDPTAEQDSILFNCAEQFMMYCKAGRFHDAAAQERIMATASPKEQKQLGEVVHSFWGSAGTRSRAAWSWRGTWPSSARTRSCAASCWPRATGC